MDELFTVETVICTRSKLGKFFTQTASNITALVNMDHQGFFPQIGFDEQDKLKVLVHPQMKIIP